MLETIEFLCREPREPGSRHSKECAQYLKEKLEGHGYLVETEKKEFTSWKLLGQPRVKIISPAEEELGALPVYWSAPTPDDGAEGKIVPAGKIKFFESFSWDRWAVADGEKTLAYLAGTSRPAFPQPLDNWKNPVPHLILGNQSRQKLMGWLEKGIEVRARVSIKAKFEQAELTNVIANPEGALVVCAHYDSFYSSPGANDNASGVAALLELAKKFAGKNIRFILFDAEELNKLGSYGYVDAHDTGKIRLVLELDSIGYGNEIELLVSEKKAPQIKETCPEAGVIPKEKIPFSDCWPFMKKGVPVIRMLSKGEEPYPHFHGKEDTPDKINPETIEKAIGISERIIRAFL